MNAADETTEGRRCLTDEEITEAVKRRLRRHPEVPAEEINALVAEGIATLSGTVRHLLEKERAVEVVESVRGVRGTVDEISVEVEMRSDADIATDIQRALEEDKAVPAGRLQVRVTRGSVALSGDVPSWGQRVIAEDRIKAIGGVKHIQTAIAIAPHETRPDAEIRSEIAELLSASVWIDERLVDLTVREGNVVLGGVVGSVAQKKRARELAQLPGVRSVDDSQLAVHPWFRDEKSNGAYPVRTSEEVRQGVMDVLRYDPRIRESAVTVRMKDGAAILEGCVKDFATRCAAVKDVREVIGVSEVEDHLQIPPSAPVPDDDVEAAIGAALLEDPFLSGFKITVSAVRGKVALKGDVNSHFAYDRAGAIASSVRGVREIRNNLLVVVEHRPERDDELRQDVEQELFWNPLLGSSAVSVSVEHGTVTLAGEVSVAEKKRIATTAAMIVGARKIRNNIVVTQAPS